jgi:predicted nucleic acid-binding protein
LHKGIEIAEVGLILDTLERFARVNVDFPDCYAAALAAQGATPVTSYDRDFRRFPDVTCHSPDDILRSK